jgi:predicted SAM-dependent methyltransferase
MQHNKGEYKMMKFVKKILAKRRVKKLLKKHEKIKLNLGCGQDYKEGWINIDNNSDNNIAHLDINYDLANGIPFPDNSVDFIFNEHFLEHLTPPQAEKLLRECIRVMRPGAVMRISVPDLVACVQEYTDVKYFKSREKFRKSYGYGGNNICDTFNMNMRSWGHMWMYDWDGLVSRLTRVGIARPKIRKYEMRISALPELQELETRLDSKSIIAEVRK